MAESQLSTARKDIRTVMEGMKGQFAMALPKLITVDRFLRVALTCVNKNAKLLQCTQESLLACLLDCAALGIEPDGRRAHLIPYGDKCTLIIDYKGIAELVRRSGEVATLHCGIVYPGDEFDYAFGTGQFLKHKPSLSSKKDQKPTCVYSYVKLKDGQEDFDVMSIEDVERIRKRSRSGNNGPWMTDFDEMSKKTVFRRHSKWLPLSPELRDKLEKDDEPLTEQERFAAAKPIISFGEAMPGGTEVHEEEEPAANDLPTVEGDAPSKSKSKAKSEKPAPPRATPLQAVRNLMTASNVEEGPLLAILFSKMKIEQGETLEKLSDPLLAEIVDSWLDLVEEMKS
jgi:recombination protein RecT